jgi:hypothetical protein
MPRPTTELTDAIRKVLDRSKGQITFTQARPELAKLGIQMADAEKDPDGFKFQSNSFNTTKHQWKVANGLIKSSKPAHKATRKGAAAKRVAKASGLPRPKYPKAGANGKAKHRAAAVAVVTATRRKRVAKPEFDNQQALDAMAMVKEHGGLKAARQEAATMREQAEALEAAANLFEQFQEQVSQVA